MMNELRTEIEDKVVKDLNKVNVLLGKKASAKEAGQMKQALAKKVDYEAIQGMVGISKNDITSALQGIRKDFSALESLVANRLQILDQYFKEIEEDIMNVKNAVDLFKEDIKSEFSENERMIETKTIDMKTEAISEINLQKQDLDNFVTRVSEELNSKVDKQDLTDMRNNLAGLMSTKIDSGELNQAIRSSQTQISTNLGGLKDELKRTFDRIEMDLITRMDKYAKSSQLASIAEKKVSISKLDSYLAEHASKIDMNRTKNEILEEVNHLRESFNKENIDSKSRWANKEDLTALGTLIDKKANIEAVNNLVKKLHAELRNKVSQEGYEELIHDQSIIKETLTNQTSLARWIWHSGTICPDNSIPWEEQSINTSTMNFLWESGKNFVLVIQEGIYEVCFGFFASRKPDIQLMVNYQPVISTSNMSRKGVHQRSQNVRTGVSCSEFVVLPAKSRVSVTYAGELGGQGFLSLKKL